MLIISKEKICFNSNNQNTELKLLESIYSASDRIKLKEIENADIITQLTAEQALGVNLSRKLKDLENKLEVTIEELDSERMSGARLDKQCNDLKKEVNEMCERLEEMNSVNVAQDEIEGRMLRWHA